MSVRKLVRQFFLEGIDFLNQIYLNRRIILELTKRDFKTKYTQNYFGLLWAVLEPLAMMVALWLVFSSVLKPTGNIGDIPYPLYLISGLIAYDFFNKSLNNAMRSVKAFSFLIKQVNFRIAILPFIPIMSELVIQMINLGIVMVFCIISGIYPSLYWLQVFYFLFATCILLIGITWITSSILPFFPDLQYIITISMRLLFFVTPIFWSSSSVPEKYLIILKFNPLFYLVEGYRNSLIYKIPFWDDLPGTIIFWSASVVFLLLGILIFKRLRPHFADVV